MAEERPAGIGPVYLTLGDVLELYALIIGATDVEAGDQLRNRDGLEGALARPETYAHYQDADLALQAAVLAHGIAEGQHFIDGNKRTALVAMLTFLEINGWRVKAPDPELADWILSFSAGATPEMVATLLRPTLRRTD
jgi:death-on-curing family protein